MKILKYIVVILAIIIAVGLYVLVTVDAPDSTLDTMHDTTSSQETSF